MIYWTILQMKMIGRTYGGRDSGWRWHLMAVHGGEGGMRIYGECKGCQGLLSCLLLVPTAT